MISPLKWIKTLPARFAHRCACDEVTGILLTMERLPAHGPGYQQCLRRWSDVEVNLDQLQAKLRANGIEPSDYSMTDDEQIKILVVAIVVALGATVYLSWV